MSVINRVLQDLEERRGGVPPSAAVRAVGPVARRGVSPAVVAGVAAGVLLAGGGLAAWLAGWFDRGAPAPVVASAPVTAPPAPAAPAAPAAPRDTAPMPPEAQPPQAPVPPQARTAVPTKPEAAVIPGRPQPGAALTGAKADATPAATGAADIIPARPATQKPAATTERAREAAAKPAPAGADAETAAQPVAAPADARAAKRSAPRERAASPAPAPAEVSAEPSSMPAIEKRERPLSAAERGEATYRQGVAQIQSGRSAEAEAAFRQALAEDPRHPGARQALLGMMLDGRRTAEAEALMREGIAADPTQSSWSMVLARLQAERGDTTGGVETLRAALAQGARQGGEFHALLAALLQRAGDHKGAVQSYQDALATPGARPVWHMGQAISLRELGRKDEARAAFQRAIDGGLPGELRTFVERQLAALGR